MSKIQIRDLNKTFFTRKGSVKALESMTLDVDEGEFVSIVGASGCGKSTLLRIIAGVIGKTSGEVMLEGHRIEDSQLRIGMVFQNPVLLPWRSVLGNVVLLKEIQPGIDRKQMRKDAEALLELVGLSSFKDSYPFELSGGMQQRAALCRALLIDPQILLMDEPFGALDALTRERMNFELTRIWSARKKTVLFVTHSIQEAIFLSDRVAVMTPRPGRISKIMDIELPRPRNISVLKAPQVLEYSSIMRDALGVTEGIE